MDQHQILDNLSTHLKNAIARAISLASSMRHGEVNLTHILLSLLEEQGSIAAELLHKIKLDKNYLLYLLSRLPQANLIRTGNTATTVIPELSSQSKKTLEKAMLLAYEREHDYVGTEHLLYGIFESKDREIEAIIRNTRLSKQEINDQIEAVLNSTSHFPDMDEVSATLDQIQSIADGQSPMLPPGISQLRAGEISKKGKLNRRMPTALEIFTLELTDKNRQKNIDPVIGREKEIERLINILCRRTKNNPVLVGEAGVGKTAIVEGLAKKIVEGNVPALLKRKKVSSLDLTMMISGTIYRGEFEARLKQLIDELSARPDHILFIDELHNIIGAGSNQGTMDAANILKPALARGLLHCIGATTIDEYKKYISNDPALERRFQSIQINEPNKEETIAILQGIKKYYENFHHTTIANEAIETAVELSVKYIHDYFLPDKAIDLVDEAAASVRVKQKSDPDLEKIYQLEDDIKEIQEKKETAIATEKFTEAIQWKEKAEELLRRLKKIGETLKKRKKTDARKRVAKKDIANVLAAKIQVDPEILLADEWERLESLPERLKKNIIGQDSAIGEAVQAMRQAQLGMNQNRRPLTSLFFIGPSGVGKTELAKVLARELYFDEKALVKLDMSEFSEAHGVSKLLGSPAGYVGYKERNKFLDTIRSRPYSVVLFDEFDKAHPDVRRLLFQILDEGELTDSAGKKISFKHAIIILTSNLGSELFKSAGIGFGGSQKTPATGETKELNEAMLSRLKEEFGTALIGRVKKICVFRLLAAKDVEQIVKNFIDKLSSRLAETKQLSIVPDAKAIQALAAETYDADIGARNLEHVVEGVLHELIITELQKKSPKTYLRLTKVSQTYKLV